MSVSYKVVSDMRDFTVLKNLHECPRHQEVPGPERRSLPLPWLTAKILTILSVWSTCFKDIRVILGLLMLSELFPLSQLLKSEVFLDSFILSGIYMNSWNLENG